MYSDSTGHSWDTFWRGVKYGWNNIDWGKVAMVTFSALEIIGGIALLITGYGAPAGALLVTTGLGLIGVGMGSLITAENNEKNGGSYWAGWAGSQVGGLVSLIPLPGIAGAVGGYLGSVVTDWIDYGWNNIDLEKARWTVFFSGFFHFASSIIGHYGNQLLTNIVASIYGFITNLIVGGFNSNYNKKKPKKGVVEFVGPNNCY